MKGCLLLIVVGGIGGVSNVGGIDLVPEERMAKPSTEGPAACTHPFSVKKLKQTIVSPGVVLNFIIYL